MTSDVTIRPLKPNDLEAADRMYRPAFGTFAGHPDPIRFAGDAATVSTRYLVPEKTLRLYMNLFT